MTKKYFSHCLLSLILLLLTACGFELRGQDVHAAFPPSLKIVYLQMDNPYGSLESKVRQMLHSSDVQLVSTAHLAPVTIHVYKSIASNANVMIGPSSQSRSYTLTDAMTYAVMDANGRVLLGPETLQASRTLILSANQLPQSNNQSDILNREMERDIISQFYNRLRSQQVENILEIKKMEGSKPGILH